MRYLIILLFLFSATSHAYKLGTTEVPEIDLNAYGYEQESYNYDDAEFDRLQGEQRIRDEMQHQRDLHESEHEMNEQIDYDY